MQPELISDQEKIIELIPQKTPFVMIDRLVSSGENSTTSGLLITEDNIFTKDGLFQEPGIVENIAQTGAVRAGYIFSQMDDKNIEPPVGFIGAVKGLNIHFLPKVGDMLHTTITVEQQVFDITLVSGVVMCNGEEIANCKMKIFVQNSGDQAQLKN